MPVYRIRRTAETYGQAVGILVLDSRTPYVPGDTCNASTYDYPVMFKTVPGIGPEIRGILKPIGLRPILNGTSYRVRNCLGKVEIMNKYVAFVFVTAILAALAGPAYAGGCPGMWARSTRR
jgi:hypothetical protein